MKISYKNLNISIVENNEEESLMGDLSLFMKVSDINQSYKKIYGESLVESFLSHGQIKLENQQELVEYLSDLETEGYEEDDIQKFMTESIKNNDDVIHIFNNMDILNIIALCTKGNVSGYIPYDITIEGTPFWVCTMIKRLKYANEEYSEVKLTWDQEAGCIQKGYYLMKTMGIAHTFTEDLFKVVRESYMEEFDRILDIPLTYKFDE